MCVYNVLIVLAVLCVTKTINCVDWTLNCSTGCHCKWMNGKKSANCSALSLTQLPANLSTEIQVLLLNENNVQTLNREEFNTLGLDNLQKIFLKRAHVKYLHRETFKNLKILVELDLSENQIEQLDKQTFAGNDRLRILLLYGNPLRRLVADQFPALPYLRTIDLHSCSIASIDETSFSNVDLLEYLDLKQNQLAQLPGSVFNHMKNLKTLLLDENPWACDCRLKSFRNWYVKNNLNRISLRCKAPHSLLDQHWESIHEDAFGCAPVLKILNEDVSLSDLESNITFKCTATGDPPPAIGWRLDGKEIDSDNVVIDGSDDAGGAGGGAGGGSHANAPHVSSVAINSNSVGGGGGGGSVGGGGASHGNKIWSNLSIYNITNLNAGFYTCFARNDLGYASQNVSLLLPEVGYEHVLIKNNDSFWYVGLVVGIFGTIACFLLLAVVFCACRRVTARRRLKKNLKGSVSFNDQEKKLLDLSITTTNERESYGEMLNTPSSATNKTDSSIIALEPVQITIENFHHHPHHHLQPHPHEYPLSVGLFPPPPPEFCSANASASASSSAVNGQLYQQQQQQQHHQQSLMAAAPGANVNSLAGQPPYGNIFISVSLTQDSLENELNMYPDLLNIVPNRLKSSASNLSTTSTTTTMTSSMPASQIVPINIESYATLPRNKLLSASGSGAGSNTSLSSGKTPVSILKQTKKNYDKPRMLDTEVDCMAGLIISGSGVPAGDISNKCVSCSLKSDNMGLRVTASGNTTLAAAAGASSLSIPDEELEEGIEEDERGGATTTTTAYHHHHQTEQQFETPASNAKGPALMPSDFVSL